MIVRFNLTLQRPRSLFSKVRLKIKNPLRKLAILALIPLLFYTLPLLIEYTVESRIDLKQIRSELERRISEKSNLRLRIQGVRYHFYYGIIFSGVTLQSGSSESSPPILRTENMILKVSYWELIRGEFPFTNLSVHGGQFNPWSLKNSEWSRLYRAGLFQKQETPGTDSSARRTPSVPPSGREPRPVDQDANESGFDTLQMKNSTFLQKFGLSFVDVELRSPESQQQNNFNKLQQVLLNLTITPGPSSYSIGFSARLQGGEQKAGSLEGKGEWKPDADHDLRFRYRGLSIHTLTSMLKELQLSPTSLPLPDILIQSGNLEGSGSFKAYRVGSAISIDLRGKFHDMGLQIPAEDPQLKLEKGDGEFHYNLGIDTMRSMAAYSILEASQGNNSIHIEYRNAPGNAAREKNIFFSKGNLNITTHPLKKGWLRLPSLPGIAGELSYQLLTPVQNDGRFLHPAVSLALKNVEIRPGVLTHFLSQKGSYIPSEGSLKEKPSIQLDEYNISVDPFGKSEFSGIGSIKGARMDIKGNGAVRFLLSRDRNGNMDLVIDRDSKSEIIVDGLTYRQVAGMARAVSSQLWSLGTKNDSLVSEDQGPLWWNRFTDSTLFRKILHPSAFDSELTLRNMGSDASLPSELKFHAWKRGDQFQMQLNTPSPSLTFQYLLLMDGYLPHHNIQFNLRWPSPALDWKELTGSNIQPRSVAMDYKFTGEGFLPGDLVSRSTSLMSVTLTDIDIKDTTPGRIAIYSINLHSTDLYLNELKFQRSTEGISINYGNIQARSPTLSAYGSGQIDTNVGGKVVMRYLLQDPEMKGRSEKGSLEYRILKDNNWVPATDL